MTGAKGPPSSARRRGDRERGARTVFVPGAMVDHYKVMRLLGRGGMGEVYLARDTQLGRRVALKVIRGELLISDKAKVRFMREARTTAKFNHPNIVTIFGVGEHRGRSYVALEYLEGQNLSERVLERHPSLPETLRFCLAIAEALEEAHRHGVLHRDLKPANVVLARDGRLRVVDFGLATTFEQVGDLAVLDGEREPPDSDAPPAHVQSAAGGTPAFMAPEQWRRETCSDKTDVWALGVMLFQLCVHRLPFSHGDEAEGRGDTAETVGGAPGAQVQAPLTARERMRRRRDAVCGDLVAESLDEFVDLSPALVDLVARCLDKNPTGRPSAAEAAAILRDIIDAGRRRVSSDASPFRGLLPFTERHSELFFGRDAEVAAFVERLRLQPVLPIVGPSGAGKSSFVGAGVLPRLREQDRWIVLRLRPGARPFRALAATIVRQSSESLASRTDLELHSDSNPASLEDAIALGEELQVTPGALAQRLRSLAEEQDANVLLFVDQLEELFAQVTDEHVRRRFVEALCTAADDALDPVRVAFTIRDDFLGRLTLGPEIREALAHVFVLQALDAEALVETLSGPVEAVGYRFEDEALPREMTAEVGGEASGLPLLQFAAQMLWEQRDRGRKLLLRSSYERMGGVAGALAKHADGVLAGMSSDEVELVRQLFLRLVTAERTRRALSREKALEGLGEAAADVLARLVKLRLLAASRSNSERGALIELAHESLLREWRTLATWVDESKDELAFLAEVGQAAELWERRGRRPLELWQGDALHDAVRKAQRCSTDVPALVERFLSAGRRDEAKRSRRRNALIGSGVAVQVVVVVVLAIQKREADQLRSHAEAQRHQAEQERAESEHRRAEALREAARAALSGGDMLVARSKLRMALEIEDAQSARALWWQLTSEPVRWNRTIGDIVYAVDMSPDGQTVAAACGDGVVYLFDVTTGAPRLLREHTDQATSIAYSNDGRVLASGSWNGRVIFWDTETEAVIGELNHPGGVQDLAFSPGGETLVTAGYGKDVRVWDMASKSQKRRMVGHNHPVHAVAVSPDGATVATAGADGTIRVWRLSDGRTEHVLEAHADGAFAVAFDPRGGRLASGGQDRAVRLWDVATGKQLRVMYRHPEAVRRLRYDAEGKRIASAGLGGKVSLWDADSGALVGQYDGKGRGVRGLAIGPSGDLIATGDIDKRVRVIDTRIITSHGEPNEGHSDAVGGVSFSPDGQVLATGGRDRTVALWDVPTGRKVRVLEGHVEPVHAVRFSPKGDVLASAGRSGTRLWEASSGRPLRVFASNNHGVAAVDFSPDGQRIALAAGDAIAIHDVATGDPLQKFESHDGEIWDARFDPTGERIASASGDGTVRIWDSTSGEELRKIDATDGVTYGVAWAGERLLSAGSDGATRLWTGDGALVDKHDGRTYWIDAQGGLVGIPRSDQVALLVGLDDGHHLVLRGHRGEVNFIALSKDGRLAATTSDDGTVRVWQTDTGMPFWRAPLMLTGPVQLLSHNGWETLSADAPQPAPSAWQESVRKHARVARADEARRVLCVVTGDERVELWHMDEDRRVADVPMKRAHDVYPWDGGCLVRAGQPARAFRVAASGLATELAGELPVRAVAVHGTTALVANGVRVSSFPERRDYAAGVGVVATAISAGQVMVGYRDGNIAGFDRKSGEPKETRYELAPSSPAVSMLAGPQDTLIVGYANGTVGLWDQRDGARLAQAKMHGQVTHLAIEAGQLYAATDLGLHLQWDLRSFARPYCDLLGDVWKTVPTIWESGHAQTRRPPEKHRCVSQ